MVDIKFNLALKQHEKTIERLERETHELRTKLDLIKQLKDIPTTLPDSDVPGYIQNVDPNLPNYTDD